MNTRWLAPLYAYPFPDSEIWNKFFTLRHVHAVVANPADGYRKGMSLADMTNWHWAINQCRRRGIIVIGYLATDWGKRPMQDLKDEMAAYARDFLITGFFLDEAATSMISLPYYTQLRNMISGMVVLNPGTQVDHRYFSVADIIITRETDATDIVPSPDELKEPNKCCHILTGFDALRTLQQFQKFPDLGFRWFTEKSQDYTGLADIIPFLDSELL